ncbi:hypothetical protein Thiowin_03308 [Thiorhodovibrio winogradskyi]|uniref:Uncharacterized protein n=2 Tax=Thiorhodovibrio winogradskyi TaxID=77007 RepID=A0ABZ0SCE8_9GAMM
MSVRQSLKDQLNVMMKKKIAEDEAYGIAP